MSRRILEIALIFRPGEYAAAVHGEEAIRAALGTGQFHRYYVDVPRGAPGPTVDEFTAYSMEQPTAAQLVDALALVYGSFSSEERAIIRDADRPAPGDEARVTEPPPNAITVAKVVKKFSDTEFEVIDTSGGHWAVVPRGAGPDSYGPRWYAASRLSSQESK